MKKHYVVIVLGLGEYESLYARMTKRWPTEYGLIPIIHVIGWREKKANFDERLVILVNQLKTLIEQGDIVSIIGISAGASAALNAYCKLKEEGNPINGRLITVCGRFSLQHYSWYPLSVGVEAFPAFEQSVRLVQKNVERLDESERKNILTIHALFDEVVPSRAAEIKASQIEIIPFATHFFSIIFLFLLCDKKIASWLIA